MKLLLLVLGIILCAATAAMGCDTIERAIGTYVRYDLRGARLGADATNEIDRLTANDQEPAWDLITLTTGYQFTSINPSPEGLVARVRFMNAWELDRTFDPESVKDEEVSIHLEKLGQCWRIAPPFYQPHVDPVAAVKRLEELLNEAIADKADESTIRYARSVLDSARRYLEATGRR